MKLERLFEGKENSLYTVTGEPVKISTSVTEVSAFINQASAPKNEVLRISVNWSLSGLDEENYNEGFLASFRDALKVLEEKKAFVLIEPVCDAPCESEAQKEAFIQSMKHCARRIKDCTSVAGFKVPEEVNAHDFIEELSAKHQHYVFFSENEKLLSDKSIVRI